ncbi:MAG: phenylalanine--tRNA ligase subunit beta [Bacillota bacterium]
MRISLNWLAEYVEISMSPAELAEKLTMAGIAVESVEDKRDVFRGIVVGRILDITRHPNAANLFVCKVDVGGGKPLNVVTAAANVKPALLAPVALPGSRLADGKEIKTVDFRGVVSQGMLCSGTELGLEKISEGIFILEEEKPLGQEIGIALGLNDVMFELELTPNRSDCLGMIGVAREVAALTGAKFNEPKFALREEETDISRMIKVEITDPALCPRYGGRIFTGVRIGPSPFWMRLRLLSAGIRPINNIVDITNYVMLEYNQPLHAFDYDRIGQGRIIIRPAREGEKVVTLDETERPLAAEDLVIADADTAMCLAGIMGGAETEVTAGTTTVFLEAANFHNITIRKAAQRLAMRTEAALRFEKGLDPATVPLGLNRAAYWIEAFGAGKVCRGIVDVYPHPEKKRVIRGETSRINKLLGTSLAAEEMLDILNRFEIKKVRGAASSWEVEAPSYRRDLICEADLAEEVARYYGYDRIPVTIPAATQIGIKTPVQQSEEEIRRILKGLGLDEITTYSVVSPKMLERLRIPEDDPLGRTFSLMAPLSEEQAVMRTTMLGSLLETAAYNLKRQADGVAMFEVGRVYLCQERQALADERLKIGVVISGGIETPGWTGPARKADFYALKGIWEALAGQCRISGFALVPSSHPSFHPGRAADIMIGGKNAGCFGEIHPLTAAAFELKERTCAMEVDFMSLLNASARELFCRSIPRTPQVSRDLALVVGKEIAAGDLFAAIEKTGGGILEHVLLFDQYTGPQVGEGRKSLAFRLNFRHPDTTLTDTEINNVMEKIVAKLVSSYQAQIRA